MDKIMYDNTIPFVDPRRTIILRGDFSLLCGNTIESLILSLFDHWLSNGTKSEEYKKGNIIYIETNVTEICDYIKNQSRSTIQRKLKSLIDKGYLLAVDNLWSKSPSARLYGINTPYLAQELEIQSSIFLDPHQDQPVAPVDDTPPRISETLAWEITGGFDVKKSLLLITGSFVSAHLLGFLLDSEPDDKWVSFGVEQLLHDASLCSSELIPAMQLLIKREFIELKETYQNGRLVEYSFLVNKERIDQEIISFISGSGF